NTVSDEKVAGQIPAEDKEKLLSAVEDTIKWLDESQEASKEEYESRQKELEGIANPIMTKMYQGAGDAAGAGGAPGGFPGAGGAAPGGSANDEGGAGPTIEEVD
ncbi:Hsp70 chaperone, partial [Coemansia erecta]